MEHSCLPVWRLRVRVHVVLEDPHRLRHGHQLHHRHHLHPSLVCAEKQSFAACFPGPLAYVLRQLEHTLTHSLAHGLKRAPDSWGTCILERMQKSAPPYLLAAPILQQHLAHSLTYSSRSPHAHITGCLRWVSPLCTTAPPATASTTSSKVRDMSPLSWAEKHLGCGLWTSALAPNAPYPWPGSVLPFFR